MDWEHFGTLVPDKLSLFYLGHALSFQNSGSIEKENLALQQEELHSNNLFPDNVYFFPKIL